jgi:hypothetical protein
MKLTFDVLLEAHGLNFNIVSEKTAFDIDGHGLRPRLCGRPVKGSQNEYNPTGFLVLALAPGR